MDDTQKSSSILLKNILCFDELRARYPQKRIKLRFNTSWSDTNEQGDTNIHNFTEMYDSRDWDYLSDHMYSQGANQKRLSSSDIVFQFIEISYHQWLLIDAKNITSEYSHKGFNKFTKGYHDVAEGERLFEYEPFFGRLIVNWTNKPQKFFYVDVNIVDSVEVLEIIPHLFLEREDDFVGFGNVCKSYKELKRIINSRDWKEALSSVYGVYVITDRKTGELYIGSAYGENGIYGRWIVYLESGYDKDEKETGEYPNKKLRELVKREGLEYILENFQYSILEVFPKNELGKDLALKRESYWKEVFQTRLCGYNDN